jgi:MSHA biogenesis protein MshJ
LYRHGVELVVQGSYLDMLSYMESLQALPSQLFWGRLQLDADNYPTATLTLTLYTLSLDEKWMTL